MKQCILIIFSSAFDFSLIIFHIFYLLLGSSAMLHQILHQKYNFSPHIQTTYLICSKFLYFFLQHPSWSPLLSCSSDWTFSIPAKYLPSWNSFSSSLCWSSFHETHVPPTPLVYSSFREKGYGEEIFWDIACLNRTSSLPYLWLIVRTGIEF